MPIDRVCANCRLANPPGSPVCRGCGRDLEERSGDPAEASRALPRRTPGASPGRPEPAPWRPGFPEPGTAGWLNDMDAGRLAAFRRAAEGWAATAGTEAATGLIDRDVPEGDRGDHREEPRAAADEEGAHEEGGEPGGGDGGTTDRGVEDTGEPGVEDTGSQDDAGDHGDDAGGGDPDGGDGGDGGDGDGGDGGDGDEGDGVIDDDDDGAPLLLSERLAAAAASWQTLYAPDDGEELEHRGEPPPRRRRFPRRLVAVAALLAVAVVVAVLVLLLGGGSDGEPGDDPASTTVPPETSAPTTAPTTVPPTTASTVPPTTSPPATTAPATTSPPPVLAPVDAPALLAAHRSAVWHVQADGCGLIVDALAVAVAPDLLVTTWPAVVVDPTPVLIGPDGTRIDATVVSLSTSPDVAVLRPASPLPSSVPLLPGDAPAGLPVAVLHRTPDGGLTATATAVSGPVAGSTGAVHAIDLETAFDPYAGGGPALDASGNLVAIVSLANAEGRSVGIPAAALQRAIDASAGLATPVAADCGRRGISPLANDEWGNPAFGAVDVGYGAEPVLDRLWDRCVATEWQACDDLAAVAPAGSQYEAFGATCAGAAPSGGLPCLATQAGGSPDPPPPLAPGLCIVLPRGAGSSTRTVPCEEPHDAEVFHTEPTDPVGPGGPTAEQLAAHRSACEAAFAGFLHETPYWDLLWRVGTVHPWAGMAEPAIGCFAYLPGSPLVVPITTAG